MKKVLILAAFATIVSTAVAQTSKNVTTQTNENTVKITSIRPADGSPAVFPSQNELDEKKADKIEKIMVQIRANANNPEKVEYLRKELWRFENAIVSTNK